MCSASAKASLPVRLTRRSDFKDISVRGKKIVKRGFILQIRLREDRLPLRVGFTVTRKVGGAVVRNRAKRRLREVVRLTLAELPPFSGVDIVLIGRYSTGALPFDLLKKDFLTCLQELRLP